MISSVPILNCNAINDIALIDNFLISAEGSFIKIYDVKYFSLKSVLQVFTNCLIHNIKLFSNRLFVSGCNDLKIYDISFHETVVLKEKYCHKFHDWILDLYHLEEFLFIIFRNNDVILLEDFTSLNHLSRKNLIIYSAHVLYSSPYFITFVGSLFGTLHIENWDRNKNSTLNQEYSLHNGAIFDITINNSANLIVTSSEDRSLIVSSYQDFNLQKCYTLFGHESRIRKSLILDNDLGFVSAGEDGQIIHWNSFGKVVRRYPSPNLVAISAMHANPGSREIYAGTHDGTLFRYDISDDDHDSNISHDFPSLRFLNLIDGQHVMLMTYDCDVLVYNFVKSCIINFVYKKYESLKSCTKVKVKTFADGHVILALGFKCGSMTMVCLDERFAVVSTLTKQIFDDDKVMCIFWESTHTCQVSSYSGCVAFLNVSHQNGEISCDLLFAVEISGKGPGSDVTTTSHVWVTTLRRLTADGYVCGDRKGNIYTVSLRPSPNSPSSAIVTKRSFRAHNNKGIANIFTSPSDLPYMYTLGNDGYLNVYLYRKDRDHGDELILCNSQNFPKRVERVENCVGTGRKRRHLLGFLGRHFVCYDPALDITLFKIACGGCHRSWDWYLDDVGRTMYLAFVEKDRLMVHIRRRYDRFLPTIVRRGVFVDDIIMARYVPIPTIPGLTAYVVCCRNRPPQILLLHEVNHWYELVEIYTLRGRFPSLKDFVTHADSDVDHSDRGRSRLSLMACGGKSQFTIHDIVIQLIPGGGRGDSDGDKYTVTNSRVCDVALNETLSTDNFRLTTLDYVKSCPDDVHIALDVYMGTSTGSVVRANFRADIRRVGIIGSWRAHDSLVSKIRCFTVSGERYLITAGNIGDTKIWRIPLPNLASAVALNHEPLINILPNIPSHSVHSHSYTIDALSHYSGKSICGNEVLTVIASAGEDTDVIIYVYRSERTSLEAVGNFRIGSAHSSKITGLRLCDNGTVMESLGSDGTLYLFSTSYDKKIKLWSLPRLLDASVCHDFKSFPYHLLKVFDQSLTRISGFDIYDSNRRIYILMYGEGLEVVELFK